MSLPHIFGTDINNIPSKTPYLSSPTDKVGHWRTRLANSNNYKVGLVWSGNPDNWRDQARSITLDQLSPLAKISDVSFYSLQLGPASEQVSQAPEGMDIIDLSNDLHDFSDTAAAIEQLDLVISVDTAVAHLAGALDRPIWTLIYEPADWRWLLHSNESPWYPNMRLFRQINAGEWQPVINQLAAELQLLVEQQH